MSVDWSWRPSEQVREAIARGNVKAVRWILRQQVAFAAKLDDIKAHPKPSADELDLVRAAGDGMA